MRYVALLLLACGQHGTASVKDAPQGFMAVHDPSVLAGLQPGSWAFAEQVRPPVGSRASIVVAATPHGYLNDETSCEVVAQTIQRSGDIALEHHGRVPMRQGQRCEVLGHGTTEPHTRFRFSVLQHDGWWGVTCNYDDRDAQAASACEAYLQRW